MNLDSHESIYFKVNERWKQAVSIDEQMDKDVRGIDI